MRCDSSRGAHSILITLTLVTQENIEDWRKRERELKKTIADLEKAQAKTKGKAAKNREKQVHDEWRAKDASKNASKASEKSTDLDDKLCKLTSMYGAQGNLNKPTVPDSVSVTKTSSKGASPAKKSRVEETHSAHAESPHVRSGQRHMKLPEMLSQQGSYPTKIPPKKPQRQGSHSIERLPKKSFEQDLQSADRTQKFDT